MGILGIETHSLKVRIRFYSDLENCMILQLIVSGVSRSHPIIVIALCVKFPPVI